MRDNRFIVALPVYEDWKKETRELLGDGHLGVPDLQRGVDAEPEQVQGIRATSSLFTTLGVSPALGRVFTEEEEAPGRHVVVISDNVWRNHFAARASAIGIDIRLNGQPFEVIGVMPKGFEFPYRRTACGCRSQRNTRTSNAARTRSGSPPG